MKILVAASVALAAVAFSESVAANPASEVAAATAKSSTVKIIASVDADASDAGVTPAPTMAAKPETMADEAPLVQEAALPPVPPKPKPKRSAPSLVATIDLSSQRMTIKENGAVTHVWKVSTGRSGYRTPTGTYTPKWMTKMHYSKQYDDAPMPHSVFFHHGYAVHATYETGRLGAPASHGCVRLSPANARTFFNLVSKHKRDHTRISLHGVARDRAPAYAKKAPQRRLQQRQVRRSYSGPQIGWNAQPQYTYSYAPQRTFPGDQPRRRIKPRYR